MPSKKKCDEGSSYEFFQQLADSKSQSDTYMEQQFYPYTLQVAIIPTLRIVLDIFSAQFFAQRVSTEGIINDIAKLPLPFDHGSLSKTYYAH